ncbi:MAG: helix-turn-helix domain-containing protein [Pirellulales bacterium]|nr:helix-turn-helix domain-containing protein [Pirellulales bacterium]
MAQKFYNLDKAAEMIGIPPAELNRLRERNEVRAYRDGADWKFKVEDIENLLAERKKKKRAQSASEETDDVLLSDLELEGPDEGSGTVIGPTEGAAGAESDIQLASESDLRLAEPSKPAKKPAPAASTGSEDLDLTLDEDLTFEDSRISLQNKVGGKPAGDSAVELGVEGGLEDDDLVLGGGSGSGSDITIGGDSGISLVDPTDSGLSLEEPIEFSTADEESLELGEDDMLTFREDTDTESPTELKADDDFLLTPLEDTADEDSESGSQVIALDSEADAGATVVAAGPSMAAMLDEDLSGAPDIGLGAPMAGFTPALRPDAVPVPAGVGYVPEAPYSAGVVVAMGFCVLLLAFAGMMSFDLLRNMWSWQEPYTFNSSLMDMVLGLFG